MAVGKFGSPQIGVFSPDGNNYDDPNLNKCVNCGALFQGNICPICKTVCVPEMMAGKRKTQKKAKKKKSKAWIIWIIILALVGVLVFVLNRLPDDISGMSPNDLLAAVTNAPKFDKDSYDSGIGYEELYRYPDKYKGEKVKISGYVYVAVDNDPNIAIITAKNSLLDLICITYTSKESEARLMSGDEITVYGRGNGLISYEWMSVPAVTADLIELETESTEEPQNNDSVTWKNLGDTVTLNDWEVTVENYRFDTKSSGGTTTMYADVTVKNMSEHIESFGSYDAFDAESEIMVEAVYDGKYQYYFRLKDRYFNSTFQPLESYSGTMEFEVPEEIIDSDKSLAINVRITNRNQNTVYSYKLR